MLDKYIELKKVRDDIAQQRWTQSGKMEVRCFYESGDRTSETTPNNELIRAAMGVVEHGGAGISHCATYEVGAAVRAEVLRYLDKKLSSMAAEALKEATAISDLHNGPPGTA